MSCESFQRKRGERANEPQPGAAEGSPPPGAGVFGHRSPRGEGGGGSWPCSGGSAQLLGMQLPGTPPPRSGRSSRRRAAALSPQSRLGGSRLGFLINQVRAKELFTLKKSFEEGRQGQAEQAALPHSPHLQPLSGPRVAGRSGAVREQDGQPPGQGPPPQRNRSCTFWGLRSSSNTVSQIATEI